VGRNSLRTGYIYGVTHPAHPGHVKIGKSVNPKARLRQYNTGDPQRGYVLAFTLATLDMTQAELVAHRRLAGVRVENTEWFTISPADALGLLKNLEDV
jgi:hypothetical protein